MRESEMRDMMKNQYESPELDIRWFESVDVIALSDPDTNDMGGDNVAGDDDW